jgi:hypothetical protein
MTVRYPLVLNGSTVQELQDGDSLAGTAETSDKLKVAGVDRIASVTSVANTIPVRDASADIFANVFQGVALSSKYADVAEKYIGDAEYDEGTVVVFGGEQEITVTTTYADTRVAGAISLYPGYIMNSHSEGQSVALRGKVPVKVMGIVKKGEQEQKQRDDRAMQALQGGGGLQALQAQRLSDRQAEAAREKAAGIAARDEVRRAAGGDALKMSKEDIAAVKDRILGEKQLDKKKIEDAIANIPKIEAEIAKLVAKLGVK